VRHKTRLRVFPDEGDPFPVWGPRSGESPERLGLSLALAEALQAWQRQWERRWAADDGEPAEGPEYLAWRAEGHELVRRLRTELGRHRFEVVADF